MLLGHEGIATALTVRLRERGAATARLVERIIGIPEGSIVVPQARDIHPVWVDVVSKGRYPSWMVMAQDTPLRRTAGTSTIDGGHDEVNFRYPFLIVTHVVGEDEQMVALARYRLMLVVRVLLLQDRLVVKTAEAKAELETDDMQEIVGGLAQNGERYLLEGRNEFHVRSTELIPALEAPMGHAATVVHAEGLLEPGQ